MLSINKQTAKSAIEATLYKDKFLYVDSTDLYFEITNRILKGNIYFQEPGYLNLQGSKIFNNTEFMMVTNQIQFIWFLFNSLYEDGVDIESKIEPDIINTKSNVFANLIVREQHFGFKKYIDTINYKNAPFTCMATYRSLIKKRKVNKFGYIIKLGNYSQFTLKTTACLLNYNAHT